MLDIGGGGDVAGVSMFNNWKVLVELISIVPSVGKVFLRVKKKREKHSPTFRLPESTAVQREKFSMQVESAACTCWMGCIQLWSVIWAPRSVILCLLVAPY